MSASQAECRGFESHRPLFLILPLASLQPRLEAVNPEVDMKSKNIQGCVFSSVFRRAIFVFFALALAPAAISWAGLYELDFATYMGGSQWERVQSVFIDANGYIYIAGTTKSTDFPVTPGVYDTAGTGGGVSDGFVAKLAPDGTKVIWSTFLHGSDRDDIYGIRADNN